MMNLGNNLMGFLEMTTSPTASLGVSGLQPQANPAGGENFGNLLDLVSDLQLAESQSPGFAADFPAELSQLGSSEKDELELGVNKGKLGQMALEAQVLAITPNQIVGQPSVPAFFAEKAAETTSAIDVLSQGSQLQAKGLMDQSQKLQARQAKPDADAFAQWAAALATGDIKSVRLENPQAAATIAQSALEAAPAAVLGEEASAPAANSSKTERVAGEKEGFKAAAFERIGPQAQERANTSGQSGSFAKHESNQASAAKRPQTEAAQSGSDFLLQNSVSSNSLSGAAAIPSSAVALRMAQGAITSKATLGEQSDRRVSSQNLEFVADKIDQLKAQGGGNLRIDLAPKEMGAIEIRVGMKNGVLSVELKAEQASTQSSLEASKSELMGKLERLGPAKVEVNSLPQTAMNSSAVKVAQTGSNSEAFLMSRGKDGAVSASSMGAQAQNVQSSSLGGERGGLLSTQIPTEKSSVSAPARAEATLNSSDNAWGREERREQARHRWEENFRDQKSA